MLPKQLITCTILLLCIACQRTRENPENTLSEPSSLEKIIEKGTLDISTFYNTTDYYVYQGVTRGFHYDLAQKFAKHLGVKLQITEINNNIDSAILHLQNGNYDLLAVSMTQTPGLIDQLSYSDPLYQTDEVLIQNTSATPVKKLDQLGGKEIFIQKNSAYKKVLQHLQDSLDIHIHVTEVGNYSGEDLLHLVENGEISYTIINKNIAKASGSALRNVDYSVKLQKNIDISWATKSQDTLLTKEINKWLETIRKNGELAYLYNRYFAPHRTIPNHKSKYAMIRKGGISPFDPLLKKESKRLGWDWRMLAAIIYVESGFNPDVESPVGAYGLMQIIPETANNYNVTDYTSPDSNVYAGVQYLKYLDNYFTTQAVDTSEKIKFILASYNAGAGHVIDAMKLAAKNGKDPHKWDNNTDFFLLNKNKPEYYLDPVVKNGYANGKQTYRYVQQVLDTYRNYKNTNR